MSVLGVRANLSQVYYNYRTGDKKEKEAAVKLIKGLNRNERKIALKILTKEGVKEVEAQLKDDPLLAEFKGLENKLGRRIVGPHTTGPLKKASRIYKNLKGERTSTRQILNAMEKEFKPPKQ